MMSPQAVVRNAISPSIRTDNLDAIVHAVVVVIVILGATILSLHGKMSTGDTLAVYTGAIGYAAGRSGTNSRRRVDTPDTPVTEGQ